MSFISEGRIIAVTRQFAFSKKSVTSILKSKYLRDNYDCILCCQNNKYVYVYTGSRLYIVCIEDDLTQIVNIVSEVNIIGMSSHKLDNEDYMLLVLLNNGKLFTAYDSESYIKLREITPTNKVVMSIYNNSLPMFITTDGFLYSAKKTGFYTVAGSINYQRTLRFPSSSTYKLELGHSNCILYNRDSVLVYNACYPVNSMDTEQECTKHIKSEYSSIDKVLHKTSNSDEIYILDMNGRLSVIDIESNGSAQYTVLDNSNVISENVRDIQNIVDCVFCVYGDNTVEIIDSRYHTIGLIPQTTDELANNIISINSLCTARIG